MTQITATVRHHNLRHPATGDDTRTPDLCQASSSSLGLLPADIGLDTLHISDMYIEDDLLCSDLFNAPVSAGAKPPDAYIRNNLLLEKEENTTQNS